VAADVMRLPLYLIVREMPPISSLASRITGTISERLRSSSPASAPRPSPIITASFASDSCLYCPAYRSGGPHPRAQAQG